MQRLQAPCVNAVQMQHGQARGERGQPDALERAQIQISHGLVQAVAPVVEVARHHQALVSRHLASQVVAHALYLPVSAGRQQPQVHHDDVHCLALHLHDYMQQPALLKPVIGHVFMPGRHHRPTAEQGIAMFSVTRQGVGAVNSFVALGQQVVSLTLFRPARKMPGQLAVMAAHLLQAHQIGVELLDSVYQVVDFQALGGTQSLNALVDVVSGNAQGGHALNDAISHALPMQEAISPVPTRADAGWLRHWKPNCNALPPPARSTTHSPHARAGSAPPARAQAAPVRTHVQC